MMKKLIKNVIRKNIYLEILTYIIQNKILYRILNTSGEGNFDKTVESLFRHFEEIAAQYIYNYDDGELSCKNILEIGTGVSTVSAYVLAKKTNAQKVYAYDRFHCLHKNNKKAIEKYGLKDIHDRVEYFHGPLQVLIEKIPRKSIDYIVSNAVLEHVDAPDDLIKILRSLLKEEGKMYHRVDLRCHNRFKAAGELYFHTFKKWLWDLMGNNIGHPNRLLLKDYEQIFIKNNLVYQFIKINYFDTNELGKAEKYLGHANIDDYAISTFDVILHHNNN